MYICRALLKYGNSKFSLEILEYCEPSKCLEREDYYFQLLKPEYNTAKKPGAPMSGRTHSDESKKIMSDIKKGKAKIEGSGRVSQQIEVTDFKNNTTTSYDSIREAARALNISPSVINMYFARNQVKAYKGIYTFKMVKK
jgi:hypothetical protein